MPKKTDKIDRVSVWIISIIGVTVFFGGILQIRSNLFSVENGLTEESQNRIAAALQGNPNDAAVAEFAGAEELSALQTKDTDGDTLTDFQEQYVYSTSPYLTDTDSDGTSDKDEIASGEDPLCAAGATCSQAREETTGAITSDAAQAFSDLNPDEALKQLGVGEDGTVDPEQLRKQLIELGVPADEVNKADDETLIQIFNEAVGQADSGANALVNIEQKADEIKNMTAQEKRNLLIQSGVDAATANNLTEEQLNAFFDQAIDDALGEVLTGSPQTTTPEEPSAEEQTENVNQ